MLRWIIAGLGNPGARYVFTRHNIGFLALETLARKHGIAFHDRGDDVRRAVGRIGSLGVMLLEPLTYMNRSGEPLLDQMNEAGQGATLLVLHDDLDLPLGRLRVRKDGGSGGHRGLENIIYHLGRTDFIRVRMGIGRAEETPAEHFVLTPFTPEEEPLVKKICLRTAEAVEAVLEEGPDAAMNRYNGLDLRPAPPELPEEKKNGKPAGSGEENRGD